jgi:hypothetical protein
MTSTPFSRKPRGICHISRRKVTSISAVGSLRKQILGSYDCTMTLIMRSFIPPDDLGIFAFSLSQRERSRWIFSICCGLALYRICRGCNSPSRTPLKGMDGKLLVRQTKCRRGEPLPQGLTSLQLSVHD